MYKTVTTGTEGRTKLLRGINLVADAVKITLGAKGRHVIIENDEFKPYVTNDGVTVAEAILLEDREENLGCSLIKEIATKTVDVSGDGTTTAMVLAQAIINAGVRAVELGANPVDLKRGMDAATKDVVAYLQSVTRPIGDGKMLKHIATISAKNDVKIGNLIAKAIDSVGKEGIISIEETKSYETTLKIASGMEVNGGYLSAYFVTNENSEAELKDPYILIYDGRIKDIKDILKILEQVAQTGKPILIVAEDVEEPALGSIIVNKIQGNIKICAVKLQEFGFNKQAILQDIAAFTGGTYASEKAGVSLDTLTLSKLGTADKVVVTSSNCVIVGAHGNQDEIDTRCQQIQAQVQVTGNEYDKEKLEMRAAKLRAAVAIINVGGVTELEVKEKKDRIEDALCATKAAVEEGYVPGGGIMYLHAVGAITSTSTIKDEQAGIDIIKKALEAPFRQILINGGVNPDIYIGKIIRTKKAMGYNIKENRLQNMLTGNIIDPTKVLRVALENANSISGIFLTTDCVIAAKLKDTTNQS